MKFYNKILLLFGVIFCFFGGVAAAATLDFSTFNSITTVMNSFIVDVDNIIAVALASGVLQQFVMRLWTFFSILLISYFCFDYVFGKVTVGDLVGLILTIGITKVLIIYYDSITTAFWGWSVGFAEGIQNAAVGNTELFFLPSYIYNAVKALGFGEVGIFTSGVTLILGLMFALIFSFLLVVLGVLTATWAIWVYAVAKMVGWMFIPTLMFERLEWLFNGWMRFFFGALLYNVIARVNLVLVAIVIKHFILSGAPINPMTINPIQVVWSGWADLFGLMVFMLMGVLALISTGKFASAIAGGAGGSGGGGLVLMAVRLATKGAVKK